MNNINEYLLRGITQYQICNDNTRSHDTGSVVVWYNICYKPYRYNMNTSARHNGLLLYRQWYI